MQFFETRGRALALSVAGTIILLAGAFGLGVYVGQAKRPQIERVTGLYNKETGKPEEVDFEPFWRAWNLIAERYVATNGPGAEARVWGAIQGLASSLGDPYTVFFPPEELKVFEENISGNFEGVGMEIGMREGVLTVIAPLKGTPAERAGVRTGDKVLAISGTSTASLSLDAAVRLIRGEKGSKVTLTVVREGKDKPLDIEVVRDIIEVPTLESEVKTASGEPGAGSLRNGVYIIRLFNFTAHAPEQFEKALRDFERSGSDKLVIDVRGNPGGFLNGAVDIASWFLPAGKVVVREDLGEDEEERLHRSRGYDFGKRIGKPIDVVVLIDGGSASASEILAGALREHGVAKLVGEKSFGKGSVQELIPITDVASLKLTIARWLTPEGVSISEGGLTPDVEVKMTEEDVEAKRDPQLDKAIEILTTE